jgi:hypothetical protein
VESTVGVALGNALNLSQNAPRWSGVVGQFRRLMVECASYFLGVRSAGDGSICHWLAP